MTKEEMKNVVEEKIDGTAKIFEIISNLPVTSDEAEYSEELSEKIDCDPENSGVFYTKDEEGEVKIIVDNGECYPEEYTAEEFVKTFIKFF